MTLGPGPGLPGPRRIVLPLLLSLAVGVTVLSFFLARGGEPAGPPLRPPSGTPVVARLPAGGETRPAPGAAGAAVPPRPDASPLDSLGRAIVSGDGEGARTAAAALRRSLRTDPAARERAAAVLLDPAAPPDLRRALALVFGTFGGDAGDAVLVEVLRRFPSDAGLARCALLALGGTREPEDDDDVFDLGDRPWGARGPAGLGITVKRVLGDASIRREAEGFLARPEAEVREAAAAALRFSHGEEDVREAFLQALAAEAADEPAAILGETLAWHAADAADAGVRGRIVALLLERAGAEGLDGFRFRMEDDFRRIPLEPEARRALRALAAPGRSFSVRSFALTAAALSAGHGGTEAAAEERTLLEGVLAGDGDPAARDLAARLLRRLPYEAGTAAALAKSSRDDGAWNVRFTAVETLASFGRRPGVEEALDAASADADPRVAEKARELRTGLR